MLWPINTEGRELIKISFPAPVRHVFRCEAAVVLVKFLHMNQLTSFGGCFAYPGLYHPSADVEQLLSKVGGFRKGKHSTLHVSLNEFQHHYKIAVPVGDISKENIVIYTHNGRLIVALKKQPMLGKKSLRHFRDTNYFYGTVLLPENADVEFSCAEYRKDTLEIHLSKSSSKTAGTDHQIIVY